MGIENNNRGSNRPERRLTREEQIRMRKRINNRNENVKNSRRSIPLGDPRRRINENLTEEEIIQREIMRQRKLYQESIRNKNEESELEDDYEVDRQYENKIRYKKEINYST